MKFVQEMETGHEKACTVISLHSLRGGVGSSSLALNLALAFHALWEKPTLLVDAVLTAGQMAMMMDATPRVTWEEYVNVAPNEIDEAVIDDLICTHNNGIQYVAAPRYPIAFESVPHEFWRMAIEKFMSRYDFVIVDTSHDFSDLTISMLNASTRILLVLTPEMASLRAAMSALNIYQRLGLPEEKIKIILNNNTPVASIKQSQLEKVLNRNVDMVIPHEPVEVMRAINFGQPFYSRNAELPIATALENLAYVLSSEIHKNIPPPAPSQVWKRVTNRVT